MVRIQFATRSFKNNTEGSTEDNKDKWFKQEKESMTQDEGYKMDEWEMFLLKKMQKVYL